MDWLGELCQELHPPDVILLKGRAEELSRQKEHREGYDVAVSRALASMPVLAELCLPYVKPGGLFLAMKSNKTDEEIDAARAIIQTLGGEVQLRPEIGSVQLTREIGRPNIHPKYTYPPVHVKNKNGLYLFL